jgi:hypothetical protein
VVFKSDMAGEFTVSVDKVKELRSGTKFAVLRKGPPSRNNLVAEGDVQLSSGTLTVSNSAQPAPTIPAHDLGFLVDASTFDREIAHHTSFRSGWNGSVILGATLVRATTRTTTFTSGIALVRTVPGVAYLPLRTRTTVDFTSSYGTSSTPALPPDVLASTVKTDIFHGDAERDRYFSSRFFVLAGSSFDHNFSQNLNLQQVYGVGVGWTPVQTPRQQFDLKGDVHYEKQQFAIPSGNTDLIGSTITEVYRANLPRKMVFTENGNYLPAWNQSRAYSANITATLALPLFRRFSAAFSATDNYLNNPTPGYLKNSIQYVTGLTYTLH